MKKLISYLTCLTLISALFTNAAVSNVRIGKFKHSKKATKVDQRRVTGTGTRSECQSSVAKDDLELLVPTEKVAHKTLSKSPSLYLYYAADKEINLRFTLVNPKRATTLDAQTIHLNRKGVTEINLSSEVELQENQVYLWNVVIPCSNNPSLNQEVLRAGVEKIPRNQLINRNVNEAKSQRDKVNIYAQNGIWYEALQKSLELSDESKCCNYLQAYDNLLD